MKKIIVVKDLPSNILEEAVIVLKDGVNISESEIYNSSFKKGLAVSEAESIIEECMYSLEEQNIESENVLKRIWKAIKNTSNKQDK